MAYAAVVSLSELVAHILHPPHNYSYIPLNDEREILECLYNLLIVFLDDDYWHKGVAVQSLEAEITEAAYRAQDIIEWQISYQYQTDNDDRVVKRGCCRSILSIIRKRKEYKYYEGSLLEALDHIHRIVQGVMSIQTNCRVEESSQISTAQTPALASSSQAQGSRNEMVGYKEDLVGIKGRLCGESTTLTIIPINGMGGIGKTTLARNVFDDSLIAEHFYTHAWATISQHYHLRGILLGILHSFTRKTDELVQQIQKSYLPETTDESLKEFVYRSLKGLRYLIVFDDMWSTEAWDDLRMFLPDDNNGSRVIITSRLSSVAEYVSSSPIHHMHFLKDDESWNLLQEKVFVESCPPELEEIGKFIAKSCGGLPLAIVVVAGILSKVAMTEDHWKSVADNVGMAVANADGNFSKILSLSYDHLPNHLKPCFLYMGAFSEDYNIPVSNLIKLWVAEGFLKPIESKSLEEAAEEYLEDLVKRNLVLVTNTTWTGKFKFCGMHDMLRDLCIQKADGENFLAVADRNFDTREIDLAASHRVAISFGIGIENMRIREFRLRSLLQFTFFYDQLSGVLLCSRLVRVVVTPNTWLTSFPDEITRLLHLRYVAFMHNNLDHEPLVLPSAISKLQNLQTVIIHRILDIELTSPVPLEIWKLPQLRHVILKGTLLLIPPSPRTGGFRPVLEDLQTVSKLINFRCTRDAVAMIPNVKVLKLVYTSREWSELCLYNLVHLNQLEMLKLDLLDPADDAFQYFCSISYALCFTSQS